MKIIFDIRQEIHSKSGPGGKRMLGQSVFNVALLKGVFTTTSRFQTISFDSDAVTVQTVDNTKKTPMVVPKKIMTFLGLSKGRVLSKRAPFLQQTLEVSEGQRRAPQWRQGG